MYDDNQIKIIGNLGFDAETRFFERGQITEMRVAVYAGKDKPANWVKVKMWGEINDHIREGLVKGARVTVRGSLGPIEVWISKMDSQPKGTAVVIAEEIEITPWTGNKAAQSQDRAQPAAASVADDGRSIDSYDDESIPF